MIECGILKEEEIFVLVCAEWIAVSLSICSFHPDCCFMPSPLQARQM